MKKIGLTLYILLSFSCFSYDFNYKDDYKENRKNQNSDIKLINDTNKTFSSDENLKYEIIKKNELKEPYYVILPGGVKNEQNDNKQGNNLITFNKNHLEFKLPAFTGPTQEVLLGISYFDNNIDHRNRTRIITGNKKLNLKVLDSKGSPSPNTKVFIHIIEADTRRFTLSNNNHTPPLLPILEYTTDVNGSLKVDNFPNEKTLIIAVNEKKEYGTAIISSNYKGSKVSLNLNGHEDKFKNQFKKRGKTLKHLYEVEYTPVDSNNKYMKSVSSQVIWAKGFVLLRNNHSLHHKQDVNIVLAQKDESNEFAYSICYFDSDLNGDDKNFSCNFQKGPNNFGGYYKDIYYNLIVITYKKQNPEK